MIIRATLTLEDQTTRTVDFQSQEDADAWIAGVAQSQTYGDPSTYQATTADVTAQVEQEQADAAAVARGRLKQDVGRDAISMLNQVHEEMNISGDALVALVGNPQLLGAAVMIMGGALKTGSDVFKAAGAGKYTDDQIARILRPITQSGLI